MPTVLVPVADGTEDIELSCITDTLVRAGANVVVASVMPSRQTTVTLARALRLVAPHHIDDVPMDQLDAVVLPGGMPGAQHLAQNLVLATILHQMKTQGKWIAAICAAPVVVLGSLGVLNGVPRATCFPALRDRLPVGTQWQPERVVVCGRVITSQGPGTSIDFALTVVAVLCGLEKASEIAKGLLVEVPDAATSKL
jgi:4-methyl-5(b-hydroxyethyl)-thiazole monophosphate biosynthesis